MKLKSVVYKIFPLIPKINLMIGRKLYPWKVRNNKRAIIKSLKNKSSIYSNIGAGGSGLGEGWINIDYTQCKNVHYIFDCRKELPFFKNSVKGLFTEHFFEHLDFNTEVPKFLEDAYRVLETGGCIRIVVPDAGKYLIAYSENNWNTLKQIRPLDDNLTDSMGIKYNTRMELINEVFRQGGQHKYAWDYETISYVLKKAGFTKVFKKEYLDSCDKTLAIDMEARKYESLYVEAIK